MSWSDFCWAVVFVVAIVAGGVFAAYIMAYMAFSILFNGLLR